MSISELGMIAAVILAGQIGAAIDIDKLFPYETGDTGRVSDGSDDAELNFTQLAAKYGHPAKEYAVYTEDGYRLKVFRLPGPRRAPPVLLLHGAFDSSDTWLIRGNGSLAIALARTGRDVWLGNVRGNKHSQGHISPALSANSTYWNFTFHEHGVYDLAATIDLVLDETGAAAVDTVGHSQGTVMHFVLLSTRPEYNDKIHLFIALAPVAYLHHSPPPLAVVLRALPVAYRALSKVHKYELYGDTSPEYALLQEACGNNPAAAYAVCLLGFLYQLTGYDLTEIEPAFARVIFGHIPTAISTKNLYHYGQVTIRKTFARFDYGPAGNAAAYGSREPPPYDLGRVTCKTVLLTATNDFFSAQADVALLRRRLGNVVRFVVIPRAKMNHVDYIWGEHMSRYLFPYIFNSLERYGGG